MDSFHTLVAKTKGREDPDEEQEVGDQSGTEEDDNEEDDQEAREDVTDTALPDRCLAEFESIVQDLPMLPNIECRE